MARITIELNTDLGDTLQDVVNAILAHTKPVPHGNTASGAASGDLTKVHPFTEQNVLNGKAGQPVGDVVQVDLSKIEPSETVQKLVETLNTTNQPALTAMDGDRKRGEPGAGHRRRTNAEIAEDKLYFDSLNVPGHVAVAAMENGVHPEGQSAPDPTAGSTENPSNSAKSDTAGNADVAHLTTTSAISTGAERVGPGDAQDAADEAAESAKSHGVEPTLDDLRRAVGAYQKKFGMEQAARRTKEILGMPLFEVPSKDFGVMIHKVMAAVEHDQKDGAKFTPVQAQSGVVQSAEPTKPAAATRDEVNAALNDYATRYDGSLDPKQMPITREDVPRLLERLFGAGKKSFNDFEKSPENLGRVLAAVRAEIEKSTFGRTPK